MTYDAKSIKVFKGLEAVKKRPGMYIGNTDDSSGLHHMVYEVVDNSVDEISSGKCTRIEIILHDDGSCTVSDNGRGIPVDMHDEGVSAAEVILTQLHAGGKFDQNSYKTSAGLHGVGVSVVNALSSRLDVLIKRDGYSYSMSFKDGIKQTELIRGVMTGETGTSITFLPSPEIFSNTKFSFSTLSNRFKELAFLNNVVISLTEGDKTEIFSSTGGICEFVSSIDKEDQKVHENIIYIVKEDPKVEIAMRWNNSSREDILCFTNNIPQREGGTHLGGLKASLLKVFRETIQDVVTSDIIEGLTCRFSMKLADPRFDSQTKSKLVSSEARIDVSEELSTWLEEHPNDKQKIVERIKLSMSARNAASRAREIVRRKADLDIMSLPGKLADCSEKDPSKNELFIVEGDSAGGSAKQARSKFFQAILPLRGKILNVEKARMNDILKSEQIRTLITAVGSSKFGNEFSIEDIRYHKIIIMTDADVDGAHICTLLLTFFFRYMQPIIDNGFLYIAEPPLYCIKRRDETIYVKDNSLLNKYLLDTGLKSLGCSSYNLSDIEIGYIPSQFQDLITSAICNNSLQEVRNNPDRYFKIKDNNILLNDTECSLDIIYNSSLDEIEWNKYSSLKYKNSNISLVKLINLAMEEARKKVSIQRFKGLGEMMPIQLWETTMNPDTRTLRRITIEDIAQCISITECCMGEDVTLRKDFIQRYALQATIDA